MQSVFPPFVARPKLQRLLLLAFLLTTRRTRSPRTLGLARRLALALGRRLILLLVFLILEGSQEHASAAVA